MTEYTYKTDGESGVINAADWEDACDQLREIVPPAAIADGGWGWVEAADGERYEIGPLPVE